MRQPSANAAGRLDLNGLTGVLARANLVVSNDTGPLHLAEALGRPTAGIYWCGNVINAGPLTRTRHRVAVSFRTVCPVCEADQGRGRCAHNPSFVDEVDVDDVLGHVLELYEEEVRAAA
jgi:ADP-heptose:LPS heptosyltransferase